MNAFSGASLSHVLENTHSMTNTFTIDETIVIMVGANDLSDITSRNNRPARVLVGHVKNFIMRHNHTNVIVVSMFHRHQGHWDSYINREAIVYSTRPTSQLVGKTSAQRYDRCICDKTTPGFHSTGRPNPVAELQSPPTCMDLSGPITLRHETYATAVRSSDQPETSSLRHQVSQWKRKLVFYKIRILTNGPDKSSPWLHPDRSFDLELLVKTLTRVTATTKSAIDNVISNLPNFAVYVVNTAISDYYGQEAVISGRKFIREPKISKTVRDTRPENLALLNSFLSKQNADQNWGSVLDDEIDVPNELNKFFATVACDQGPRPSAPLANSTGRQIPSASMGLAPVDEKELVSIIQQLPAKKIE
ncbi:hypothetical protein J6590_081247 [Homalodisca vitripennis]|nr:hypothetical protein J6590_081247 [Homalodisca vitripennis]